MHQMLWRFLPNPIQYHGSQHDDLLKWQSNLSTQLFHMCKLNCMLNMHKWIIFESNKQNLFNIPMHIKLSALQWRWKLLGLYGRV